MSNALTHLYRFVEIGFTEAFSQNNNLYFILDKSGSMSELVVGSRTRFDIARQQLVDVLEQLEALREENGITVDVGICVFSSTSSEEMSRRDIRQADIDDLITFLDGFSPGGDTPYNDPMGLAREYFLEPTPGFRRACFFITDGVPVPASSIDDAVSVAADLIGRTGSFSKTVDNDVNIHGVAVDLFEVDDLARLDNTPRDGIPSISSANSQGLYNALLTSGTQENIIYNYTDAPFEVEYGGETYIPTPISMGEVEVKEDLAKSSLDITVDLKTTAARRWLSDSSEAVVNATIWQIDDNEDVYVIWKGRLSGTKPRGTEAKLTLDSIYTSLSRSGLGARYQRMCRHSLYGRGCRVNKKAFVVNGEPTAISGSAVTIPEAAGYPDNWFRTGMLEAPDGTLRFIIGHEGDQIFLARPMRSLNELFTNQGYGLSYGLIYGGLRVRLYPGCDRSRGTCHDKFDNLPNYGGFDWIPTRNPFDGNSIN